MALAPKRQTASKARPLARFQVKRVYEPREASDGFRVLVDRLWARGISKEKAHIDLWLKDVAPSDALRRFIHADPEEWKSFVAHYRRELAKEPAKSGVALLRAKAREGAVTLLYGSRNEAHNNATVLKGWLERAR